MNLPKFTAEEQKQFENGVIQVNGKAMNRTALGIIDAYFKLYPKTTFAELKEAFPDSLNPSGPRAPKTIFKPFTERDFGVVHSLDEIKTEFAKVGLPYEGLFFLEKTEMFKTVDGVTVIVNKLWESKDTSTGESDLENLAKQALKFGIVVNKFEARKPFGKGSYSLDILQPNLHEKISGETKIVEREVIHEKIIEKRIIPFWVWILLALALIPLILWLLGVFNPKTEVKEVIKTDTIVQVKVDTVFIKEIEDIQTKFNAVQFAIGKADIPEDAKYALYDLAKVMQKQPNLILKIEGHTSDEGDANFNQQLSENRAKAVVEFLIGRGVDASRLTYEGKGSSTPIDENNRDVNRRTEFVIIEQ
ncbi:MAG: OmpA family protein [Bacteroidales bacterium]|nr:OmpA family protein [Bacteroidales bacterium]